MTSRRSRPTPARPPFPNAGLPLLGTAPDPEVARQLGVSLGAVKAERKARGIAPCPPWARTVDAREVSRTVKFTSDEAAAQDAALDGQPWASWAHDELVAAGRRATRRARSRSTDPTT